jgi:acyl-CoA synthetase (AMP-forming)/AMP-acid ligase II
VRRAGDHPGRGFFSGYLKDPEATAAIWQSGYLNTGDLVRVDAQGYFYFVDRKKNIIRRSGENIAAVEVEGALLAHPAVRTVGVSAVPDPVRCDEVMACIIAASPIADEPARERLAIELVEHCLDRLAYYKAPGYIAFCDALPLTPTQKIQRSELKAFAHERLRSAQCIDLRARKVRRSAA